ncbi:protein ALP1-like [Aphis craccivora]|uniref:Protein ALP1-like n=1 Tax=Aphis craccivora TaxID=307492 RepID=A0A6G0VIU3_APHCR|nr:protein ALP1-like [Aphis craccivora]
MLKIPHFIGIFSRDKLPLHYKHGEAAIVNLDIEKGGGTHWVAYRKIGKQTLEIQYNELRSFVSEIFIMYTITLSGNSSELSCEFFPPTEVGKNAKICLLAFQTNNSIPNINKECDQIGFINKNDIGHTTHQTYSLPTGSYELSEIEAVIKHILTDSKISFELRGNKNTLKCEMQCDVSIDLSMPNSIGEQLGFEKRIYDANIKHQSDKLINITKTNCIYIESNLVAGSFKNGKQSHTIHEFYPNVPPGYKLIDLRGEPVSIRLLIQDL